MVPMGVLDPEYLAWGPKREASVLAARDNALREGRPSWLTSDDTLRERRQSWLTSETTHSVTYSSPNWKLEKRIA